MPNRKEHQKVAGLIGGVVAAIVNLADQSQRQRITGQLGINVPELFVNVAAGYAVALLAGVLPDALEPADCPGHRASCHSLAAGTALAIGMKKLNENPTVSKQVKTFGTIAGAGYLSHLLLDSQTPAGLPIC